jgi:hypothetical protein
MHFLSLKSSQTLLLSSGQADNRRSVNLSVLSSYINITTALVVNISVRLL